MNDNKVLGISFLVACVVIGLLISNILPTFTFGNQKEDVVENVEQDISREEILASDPPGPYPVLSGGAITWQDVYVTALVWPEYKEALILQESVSSLKGLTDAEFFEKLGKLAESGKYDQRHSLKMGTTIINSYYEGNKIDFDEETLKKNRLALYNDEGKPAILVSCGNPIRLLVKTAVVPDPIIVITPPPFTPPTNGGGNGGTDCGPGTPSEVNGEDPGCGEGTPSDVD